MDLRRLCCVGFCACGGALVVLELPSLRFALASQAGLAAGWRVAAMPPSMLAPAGKVGAQWAQRLAEEPCMATLRAAAQGWQRKARPLKPTLETSLLPALQIALHAAISTTHLYQKERWRDKR